ncbi:MAG: T9SS type A sorting domain-containing protein [Bacteroidota bacterium]
MSTFFEWRKGILVLPFSKIVAFVVLCFVGLMLPTTGHGQVWIEDLILRVSQPDTEEQQQMDQLPTLSMEHFANQLPAGSIVSPDRSFTVEEFVVRDFQGKVVWQKRDISEAELREGFPVLQSGMYFVQLSSSSGIVRQTISVTQ